MDSNAMFHFFSQDGGFGSNAFTAGSFMDGFPNAFHFHFPG